MNYKYLLILLISVLTVNGCTEAVKQTETSNTLPNIFPDYIGITIPPNIAPLNFKVKACEQLQVTIQGKNETITCNGTHKIEIPIKKWRTLLQNNKGEKLTVKVRVKKRGGKLIEYLPFQWEVAQEPIDSHLAYRLIAPGYEAWNQMGIYQRDLESFKEKVLYDNTMDNYSCINCHSFCNQDPHTFAFHSRVSHNGTFLTRNGQTERLNMKNNRVSGASRYPIWHPSGKYMAFSINDTKQFFHSIDKNRIEVYDKSSDVVIYDVEKHCYITPKNLMRKESFETFPAFSADGKTLYFCSADSILMPDNYTAAKYSLCKTSFDPSNGAVGNTIDTLFNARTMQKSVTMPRVSPDGKFLMLSMADYGQFHIWHKEADICLIDLQTGQLFKPNNVNSDDAESYHSWSSNSRWFVVASRRADGLHSVPYFAHIDEQGNTSKAFMLPQKDADFYDYFLKSYNIPELITGAIEIDALEMDHIIKHTPETKVK